MDDAELTETERQLVTKAAAGEELDLRAGDQIRDDPAKGAEWLPHRVIRAAILYALCTGRKTAWSVHARGIRLSGARLEGALDLEAAELRCPLWLQDCYFRENVRFCEAQLPVLRLTGSRLPSLDARQLHTRGDVDVEGVHVEGEVRLLGAHIGGQLAFAGATLTNPDGGALIADEMVVDGGMFCDRGFSTEGEVRLVGAHIGGQLAFAGATLTNPNRDALSADRLSVAGGMFCHEQFSADGQVRLLGAHIGGQLAFTGATLTSGNDDALSADGMVVDGGMFCDQEFSADGQVRLLGAHIGGQLAFVDATLINHSGYALDAERMSVQRDLLLRLRDKPIGGLNFTHTYVGGYFDTKATWPEQGQLCCLDGLTYDAIEESDVTVKDRLRWLELDDDYHPWAYEQLIATYRRAGHEGTARRVGKAKQAARRRRGQLPRLAKWWSVFLAWTVRYGYHPSLALAWLVGLWIMTSALFWSAEADTAMVALRDPTPGFRPWLYALDLVVPLVDLAHEQFWRPEPSISWECARHMSISCVRDVWHPLATLLGWLLAGVGAAGVVGVLKRD